MFIVPSLVSLVIGQFPLFPLFVLLATGPLGLPNIEPITEGGVKLTTS